jgi:hypothetical protein
MWWRLTKAIIVSWLVGVMCGAVAVAFLERRDRAAPAVSAGDQSAPPTPSSPGGDDR